MSQDLILPQPKWRAQVNIRIIVRRQISFFLVFDFTEAGREKVCENYKNGSRYEGEVRNGVREGKGKYYYNNGGYYEGSWKDGKMNGK